MKRLLTKPVRIKSTHRVFLKALIHVSILFYLGWLLLAAVNDALGPDPLKTLLHNSGQLTLILLLVTMSISPAAKHLPCGDLIHFRRLIGLYGFFSAFYHLVIFTLFDVQLDWNLLLSEIIERQYITLGMAALFILFLLAITSTMAIRRKMGRRWQQLHNFIYLSVILGLIHFSWSEKTLIQSSLYYWIVAVLLFAFRLDSMKRFARKKLNA